MEVIPSINAPDFEGVKKRIKEIQELGIEWGHIDVADGRFTSTVLWNNPEELRKLEIACPPKPWRRRGNCLPAKALAQAGKLEIKIEAHLMVVNPDEVLADWLETGVKRLIVHIESAKNVEAMAEQCQAAGAELALAINPDTPIEALFRYQDQISQVLILAVNPGPSGQEFRPDQLGKIKALRLKMPDVKIEVDGGINLETAKLCKKAGADMLVSASYIFESKNPKKAYQRLKAV